MTLNILGQMCQLTHGDLGDSTAGEYDSKAKTITIDQTIVPGSEEYFTLILHEMVHGALIRAGFHHTSLPDLGHEVICEIVANVVVDNFDLQLKGAKPNSGPFPEKA